MGASCGVGSGTLRLEEWLAYAHRASEETILDRFSPQADPDRRGLGAAHILVLIDDPDETIIEPLSTNRSSFHQVYPSLMEGGGTVTAWRINDEQEFSRLADRFQSLLERQYTNNPLLFAMGDGNHSLATAKSCWLDIRKGLSEEEISNHPARWALVEVQNIYDPGIVFEPIHRLLFSIEHQSFLDALGSFCASYETKSLLSIGAGPLPRLG